MSSRDLFALVQSKRSESATSNFELNGQDKSSSNGDETRALKRRIAHLEAENERLKASVYLLTERLNHRRDSSLSMETLIQASSAPTSLTPSPTMLPSIPTSSRRQSHDISAIHSRPSKEQLILGEDLDDTLHLNMNGGDQFLCRATLMGHESAVYQCRFAPDSSLLATTGMDGTVRLWNINTSADTVVGKHKQSGSDLAWVNSTQVASSSLDTSVKLWDLTRINADAPIASYQTNGVALSVAAIPNSTLLVCGTSSGSVALFDSRSPEHAKIYHAEGAVNAVCCGVPNLVICGDSKGTLRAFDSRMAGHQDLFLVEGKKAISGIAWSRAGFLAVNSYDNALRIFTKDPAADTVKLVHTLRGHKSKNQPIRSAFSPEIVGLRGGIEVFVATGSSNGMCHIYGPLLAPSNSPLSPSEELLSTHVLQGHQSNVYSCDVSSEYVLATCSADASIKLWVKRT